MYQPRVFSVKLQLHFGGDVHEISVPAYDGAEPTVSDLTNVIERDFRVPRALQHLVFHGQELHTRLNEPLSRFGIKNLATIRLVGRMAPVDMIPQINAQYQANSYQQPYYSQPSYQQPNMTVTYNMPEQSVPYYYEPVQQEYKPSVGTQYDPPAETAPTDPPPATPSGQDSAQLSERSNAGEAKPPATPTTSSKK